MTHPAIKSAIEALEIAQEELHGLNRTFTAREVVGKRLTALRALEGCVVIERGEAIQLTDEWLGEIGFKWSQEERQPTKHWMLTLGWGAPNARARIEDLSIELASGAMDGEWFCWLRRGTRFSDNLIHIRHIKYRHELTDIITALTGTKWNPENSMYGNFYNDKMTEKMRPEYEQIKSAAQMKGE